jgi:hypothetical protein
MDFLKVLLSPISEPPWQALVAVQVLLGYYAVVRLTLWRMKAIFFDVASLATIALWFGFWRYQIHMREWEKTVVAPIRIDLFLAVLVLYPATIISLVSSWVALLRTWKRIL